MIEITVYFERGIHLNALIKTLRSLPEAIRPVYFAEDEGKIPKANKLTDEARFQSFLKENPLGFFLYTEGKKVSIDVSVPITIGHVTLTLYLDDGVLDEIIVVFFRNMASYKPLFGYACEYEEYIHRNRHFITIGKNHIESWIGRDLDKYIPGVYWYTLFSDRLLKKHHINFDVLAVEAVLFEALGDGSLHLLKFFGRPKDWRENANHLDDLCVQIDGVFSKRVVEVAMTKVTSYLEYDDLIRNWP